MPRRKSRAELTGAAQKNRARYAGRNAPPGGAPLGGPPDRFDEAAAIAFERLRAELPWLRESDRALTELAAVVRARVEEGDASTPAVREFRALLTALGASPIARKRVADGDDAPGDDDPFAAFEGGRQ